MANNSGLTPYRDTGTGAYEGPPASVTYGTVHDPEPTGLVDGPPVSVTVESPPAHLSEPTGAHPNPPESVTTVQWPAQAEAKAMDAADVEHKAVTPAKAKAAKAARKES